MLNFLKRLFGRGHKWYRGPSNYKQEVKSALHQAKTELSGELKRPLKWDYKKKNRVTLLIQEPTSHVRGIPQIPHPTYGTAGGYATPHSITLPRGFRHPTLIHEAGHVVLFQNGIHGDHHKLAPRFFNRHAY